MRPIKVVSIILESGQIRISYDKEEEHLVVSYVTSESGMTLLEEERMEEDGVNILSDQEEAIHLHF